MVEEGSGYLTYILDTNSFRVLEDYYPAVFGTLWTHLDALVAADRLLSVREVKRELDNHPLPAHLATWVQANARIFRVPDARETGFVRTIMAHPHYKQLVAKKHILRGNPQADPFLIAAAHVCSGSVVTQESAPPNGAKIPNACQHFGVACTNLEGLMKAEGWSF